MIFVFALAGTDHRGSSTRAVRNSTLESHIHAAEAATAAATAVHPGKRAWYNAVLNLSANWEHPPRPAPPYFPPPPLS